MQQGAVDHCVEPVVIAGERSDVGLLEAGGAAAISPPAISAAPRLAMRAVPAGGRSARPRRWRCSGRYMTRSGRWTVERATCVTLRRRPPMFICDWANWRHGVGRRRTDVRGFACAHRGAWWTRGTDRRASG